MTDRRTERMTRARDRLIAALSGELWPIGLVDRLAEAGRAGKLDREEVGRLATARWDLADDLRSWNGTRRQLGRMGEQATRLALGMEELGFAAGWSSGRTYRPLSEAANDARAAAAA